MGENSPLPSRIASLVHAHFDALPTRSKPHVHPNGPKEWIPMTGIVAVKGENSSEKLTCVAVTSGAKCLPASQISQCRGLVLHDSHAEILALRAFNYWLLNECYGFLAQERIKETQQNASEDTISSPFIRRSKTRLDDTPQPPFEISPDITFYMYCTCAPCGDASMELCMAAQEDPTPWEVPKPGPQNEPSTSTPDTALLSGRAHFSLLGVVRRKPARVDAESTRSKSCSDKLALRQVSSLLSHETSLLVAPTRNAYLEGVILPEEEISRVACERCFSETGRMEALNGRFWAEDGNGEQYGYRFHPFKVLSVPTTLIDSLWAYGKPKPTTIPSTTTTDTTPQSTRKSKPGNVSAVWTIAPSLPYPRSHLSPETGSKLLPVLRGSKTGLYETLINGVKQGNRAASPLARGASALSRARFWGFLRDMVQVPGQKDMGTKEDEGTVNSGVLICDENLRKRVLGAHTYQEFKKAPYPSKLIKAREEAIQDAREVLKGWVSNSGDENWALDVLIDPKKRKRDELKK